MKKENSIRTSFNMQESIDGKRYNLCKRGHTFSIDVYYNSNNTISVIAGSGKYRDLSDEFVKFVNTHKENIS